jgi:toxin YoeB
MIKAWYDDAWEEYVGWQTQDKKTLKRINALLKGNLSGWWSRRMSSNMYC